MTVPTITAHLLIHKSTLLLIFFSIACLCIEEDTLSSGVVIKDPQTLVSHSQIYKLGFFSPPNNTNRYLAIFFSFSEETAIWIANRDTPLKDSSGSFTLSRDGNLVVLDGTNQAVWSTNITTTSPAINSTVQLLDTGNLVLRKEDSGETLWESFLHPTDVQPQEMALSQNVRTGKQVLLTTWKSATDPGTGRFTGGLDVLTGTPQLYIRDEAGRPIVRSGPWNGYIFLGIKTLFFAYLDGFNHVTNDSAGNYFFTPQQQSDRHMISLVNYTGGMERKAWNGKTWDVVMACPETVCDVYGTCGPFGSCNVMQSPICSCLKGFEPVNEEEWRRGNWTNGCRRKKQLLCGDDGFARLQNMKIPDFAKPFPSRVQDECQTICRRNCSCIAYAYDDNIGCMFWSDILIDTQEFGSVGVNLYLRLSESEFGNFQLHNFY